MSKITSGNPFLEDDFEEVDDEEFLNSRTQGSSGYLLRGQGIASEHNELENRRMQLLEERRRIEERTLQSTHNSLGLLHESEQVGILTAEELVKQREQLQNIDENLDNINSTMRTSQKHINSIKSIFGGIKNFFNKSGTDPSAMAPVEVAQQKPPSKLSSTIDNLRADASFSQSTHPAFRVRDLPYDEADAFKSETPTHIKSPSVSKPLSIDDKLDNNLENMCLGLGRLKNLAIDLNEEIGQQNEMLDTIHNKADKADETLEYQNRQIKRILKK